MENDTETGGEELATSMSMDEAVAAFAKTLTTDEADTGQSEAAEDEEQGTETDDDLQASQEGEGEETDGDTEDEGQADEENDEEPESDQGRFVASNGKVRLPDGTVSTVADLIAGNLRDRDYRQKTMETAELRKSFESQSAAIKERETQLEQQSTYVADLIRSIIPQVDPEWADPQSPKYDPAKYLAQKSAQEQWAHHLAYLDQQRQQSEQESKVEADKRMSETASREWNALLERVPAFKDKAKWTAFAADANKYGAQYGFKPEELRNLAFDHRQIVVLRKAILWDKLQASKPKVQQKVENRPPVQKGGKRLNPAEHRAKQGNEALARLKQTGSIEDATAAYIASLNQG